MAMAMAMATMATCATSSSSFLATATTALSSCTRNSSSWEAKCFLPFGGVSHKKSRSEALVIRANNGGDMLGGFGGRDPYPAELESNFGDKVIGFAGTEHNILIPTLSVLSLAEKTVKPVPEGTTPLTEDQAKALLRKIVGWRLSRTEAGLKLQCDWNLKDEPSVSELYSRISAVTDAESYLPEMQTLENNKVRIEVWTSSIGGLTENDFIFAAKVDQIDTKDLSRRNRTWF